MISERFGFVDNIELTLGRACLVISVASARLIASRSGDVGGRIKTCELAARKPGRELGFAHHCCRTLREGRLCRELVARASLKQPWSPSQMRGVQPWQAKTRQAGGSFAIWPAAHHFSLSAFFGPVFFVYALLVEKKLPPWILVALCVVLWGLNYARFTTLVGYERSEIDRHRS